MVYETNKKDSKKVWYGIKTLISTKTSKRNLNNIKGFPT